MNDTTVPSALESTQHLLEVVAAALPSMSPQTRKAATYVLEHPNEVGISSIREIAEAADVKPNTFVRMARNAGLSGFDEFRQPFKEELRQQSTPFPDRARWLQSLSASGKHSPLFAELASAAISNIETTFAATDAKTLKNAADAIVAARHTFVLGVGINHTLAQNFSYLASMAVDNITAIPRNGSLAIDDLVRAGSKDVLLAMTFKPYRNEVLEAVALAKQQGLTVIGITDSPASPLLASSDISFVVQTQTAQFFTSTIATSALLETLMAFVIADADTDIVNNIERYHRRRHELGIYHQDAET